jgi:hypothetical protein
MSRIPKRPLVTDSSLAGASSAFAEILAARASVDREVRRTATVRTVAGVLVALVHLLLLSVLVIAITLPPTRIASQPVEVELVLAQPTNPSAAPQITQTKPRARKKEWWEYETQPITILPPPIVTEPRTPTDIMRALGAELACGASHYEYLNTVERKLCRHVPWKLPERAFAVAPQAPQQGGVHLTGAEAAVREQAQPRCPPVLITPCIDQVIYGKGPH